MTIRRGRRPGTRLLTQALRSTLRRHTSSVRVRPTSGTCHVHLHVSNMLRPLPSISPSTKITLATELGILKGLSVTRRHLPRSKRFAIRLTKGTISFHVTALPYQNNRGIMLELLRRINRTLSIGALKVRPLRLTSFTRTLRRPRKLILMANPANDNGAIALCDTLRALGATSVGVYDIRSPIRVPVTKLGRARVRPHTKLAFRNILHTLLHRSPSIVVVKRVHSNRATRVTVGTTRANRLILSALRAGSAYRALMHLRRVKITH